MSEGFVLKPLLIIKLINDLYNAVKYNIVHHLADDKNLLVSTKKTLNIINKYINRDLQLNIDWRRSNKLSLQTSKTELVLFKLKSQKITKHRNFSNKWSKNIAHKPSQVPRYSLPG